MELLVNPFKLMLPFSLLVIVFFKSMLKLASQISVVDWLTGFYTDYRVYGEHGFMGTLA